MDYAQDSEGNHVTVAYALAEKMGWLQLGKFKLAGGATKNGMCFVFVAND